MGSSGNKNDDNDVPNLSSDEATYFFDIGIDIEAVHPELPEETLSSDLGLCCICYVESSLIIKCSEPSNPHGLCLECFQGYAKSSFQSGSEYERVQERDGLCSTVGQLPCPYFTNGSCTCTCMDESSFRRLLDDRTFVMWRKADDRIQVAQKEQDESEQRDAIATENMSPLEALHLHVQDALINGCTMSCPGCKTKGEKDDKCMHITCYICGTDWCYCCGRKRGPSSECRCDTISPCLENNPGWHSFAIDTESPGQGALYEFHRQRIMYLLKQLKGNTDATLWNKLRVEYPDLLNSVPTIGRFIDWESIDNAVSPTFGTVESENFKLHTSHPTDHNSLPSRSSYIGTCIDTMFLSLHCLHVLAKYLLVIFIVTYFVGFFMTNDNDKGAIVSKIGRRGIVISIVIYLVPVVYVVCMVFLLIIRFIWWSCTRTARRH